MPTIGSHIRSLRQRLGLLQVEIARRTGIHHSRMSLIERGWVTPRRDELAALSIALGTSLDALLDLVQAVSSAPDRRAERKAGNDVS